MKCQDGVCVIEETPYLCVQGLSVRFDRRTVLQDINLETSACSITAVVGPSGSGKSSFLASLNRLNDQVPGCQVSGSIRIGGMDVMADSMDVSVLRRRVGMIFQRPNPFPMSIRKNLTLTLKQHGVRDRQVVEQKMESTLRAVGLWDEVKDRLDASALALSGGQQQRLCIARAIVLEPDVVLFDEPCSALDPMASGTVEDLIVDLRHKFTVVIVTHNLAQARRIADTVAVFWTMDGVGRLVEHGPTTRLFEAPESPISAAYLAGRQG